ncbi:MAG: MBL fold metallo-hydrolase, partial [Solobacterium sp.]|nr:MBL fold metallo-hydrolase [Solobacterium sp.]
YDHGGGLPYVMKTALRANVYLSEHAFGSFYSMHSDGPHFIGISEEIENDPGVQLITESREIDDELFLLSDIGFAHPIPSANERLMVETEDGLMPDRFDHEICLVVSENHHRYLFSGCAHHGILNILDRFREVYGTVPEAVFSGFHMMKKQYSEEDLRMIQKTAEELCQYPTRFYTCHCTGEEPYQRMKKIMKDQLSYLHCGDSVTI